MRILIGWIVVFGCILGGFAGLGGNLVLLAKPMELVIILGGSFGGYIVAQPGPVLKRTPKDVIAAMRGAKHKPDDYLELMACLYAIMRKLKFEGGINSAGVAAIESDVNDPYNSYLFKNYPKVLANRRAVTFITDFLKMLMQGNVDAHQLEDVLDQELNSIKRDFKRVPKALQTMADGMPALGIVAAVMGVIKTMASIDKPPEVIGMMIGGALVGTFAGVLFSYGVFGPLAQAVDNMYEQELQYYGAIKAAIIGIYNEHPPETALEFSRKILMSESRPTFEQVEERVAD